MTPRKVLLLYVVVVWAFSVTFLTGQTSFAQRDSGAAGYLANVIGVSASVPPNPENTVAAQLAQKEKELNARDQALSAREQAILSELDAQAKAREEKVYVYLFLITVLLFGLLAVNFYLDHKRRAGPTVLQLGRLHG
jgi:hypothetical protein